MNIRLTEFQLYVSQFFLQQQGGLKEVWANREGRE
jgi:hypothetical protein